MLHNKGLGIEEFGVGVGAHPSSPTWEEHEGGCFSVVCYGRVNNILTTWSRFRGCQPECSGSSISHVGMFNPGDDGGWFCQLGNQPAWQLACMTHEVSVDRAATCLVWSRLRVSELQDAWCASLCGKRRK